jgi:transposase
MRPRIWTPPVDLSAAERMILTRIKRAKLFVFLRLWRHERFDVAFQAAVYQGSPKGRPPVPPAQRALAAVLQAYTGAADDEVDDEVIEGPLMDRRWA